METTTSTRGFEPSPALRVILLAGMFFGTVGVLFYLIAGHVFAENALAYIYWYDKSFVGTLQSYYSQVPLWYIVAEKSLVVTGFVAMVWRLTGGDTDGD